MWVTKTRGGYIPVLLDDGIEVIMMTLKEADDIANIFYELDRDGYLAEILQESTAASDFLKKIGWVKNVS